MQFVRLDVLSSFIWGQAVSLSDFDCGESSLLASSTFHSALYRQAHGQTPTGHGKYERRQQLDTNNNYEINNAIYLIQLLVFLIRGSVSYCSNKFQLYCTARVLLRIKDRDICEGRIVCIRMEILCFRVV